MRLDMRVAGWLGSGLSLWFSSQSHPNLQLFAPSSAAILIPLTTRACLLLSHGLPRRLGICTNNPRRETQDDMISSLFSQLQAHEPRVRVAHLRPGCASYRQPDLDDRRAASSSTRALQWGQYCCRSWSRNLRLIPKVRSETATLLCFFDRVTILLGGFVGFFQTSPISC